MAERTPTGRLSLAKLLKEVALDGPQVDPSALLNFHRHATDDFLSVYKTGNRLDSYIAAIEAAYHASLAGITVPLDLAHVLDGMAAAARQEYDEERYERVIRLLGPIVTDTTPEDLAAMLAESYAWTDNFDQAFVIAGAIVKRNRDYTWLFTDACSAAIRSRRFDYAAQALERAEALEPGSYRVALLKGRLAERQARRDDAIEYFREATDKTENDRWPFFYLARALVLRGKPREALKAIDQAREMSDGRRSGRALRQVEMALLSQELLALVLAGEYDSARNILNALEHVHDPRPEIVISTAFIRAFFAEPTDVVQIYENAVKLLDTESSRRAHTRAQVHLFRGRLLEKTGDTRRAEEEFERACDLDPHNVQMKINLLKVLLRTARQAKEADDHSAAVSAARRANEVAKSILKYDPEQPDALYALQDAYYQYRVE